MMSDRDEPQLSNQFRVQFHDGVPENDRPINEVAIDHDYDMQWVYANLGRRVPQELCPSAPAYHMLREANADVPDFMKKFADWRRKFESQSRVSDKKMIENRDETLLRLKKIRDDMRPDIELIIREASENFPDVFSATVKSLGWFKDE